MASFAAVISLKHSIRRLQNSSDSRFKFSLEPAYEGLELLGNTLRRLDDSRNRRIDRNELLDCHSGIDSVSLVGMAGIGKTHLAREIYQHPNIVGHFDFTAWVSLGPYQQVKNLWVDIVAQVESKHKKLFMEKNVITLVKLLQKGLRGRKCLIVLDDVWSTRVCDSLIRLFRADGNGSRILLTTRLEEVAKHYNTSIHQMRFLNNEESWNLLEQNVFAGKSCPPQLEKAGRKIADRCEGLPLLILTVANILRGLDKTEEYWNKVAESKTSTFAEAYDQISKILYSSYEYLPQHLKACFLYMGVFPQSFEIPLTKLINLWTIEDFFEPEPSLGKVASSSENFGFLVPNRSLSLTEFPLVHRIIGFSGRVLLLPIPSLTRVVKSSAKFHSSCRVMRPLETLGLVEPGPSLTRVMMPLRKNDLPKPSLTRVMEPLETLDVFRPKSSQTVENFGMECMRKLVSNSLAIICKQSFDYRIKFSRLHSAYWHLCVKEARKIKFFHVLNKLTDGSKDYIESQRRLSFQNNILFGMKEVYDSMAAAWRTRSLLCTGEDHKYPVPMCFNLMLLRVLDALAIRFYEFPTEVVELVQLRYLALTHNGKVTPSISKLKQLQCLILRRHHNIKFLSDFIDLHMRLHVRIQTCKLLRDSTYLPMEIWDMQQLRHLRIMGSNLPDPPLHSAGLLNLSTLYMNAHSCSIPVLSCTPNLKKLGIQIELGPDDDYLLSSFKEIRFPHGLESVKCVVVNPGWTRSQNVTLYNRSSFLPEGLKKLSLNGLGSSWEYMSIIGSLPNLQVLKLRCSATQGPTWEIKGAEFLNLEFLLLEGLDLVHWITCNDYCFRRLHHLSIRHCYKLKVVPWQIGVTLKRMEVVDCSPLLVASARQIQDYRSSSLQVVINSSWN
ncbi:hypothetical protein C2S51_034919 [Perilla frutescens var. frutescens]|nr:hypothetical protein C2S51_034919 [Perilla frutescens var. frutescens]